MLLVFALIFAAGLQLCIGCDVDQMRQGCRIENRACACGYGCISDYRYATMKECQAALGGRRRNFCYPNPCRNGGTCIQIYIQPGFTCKCEGTGFYGSNCEKDCSSPKAASEFNHECVII